MITVRVRSYLVYAGLAAVLGGCTLATDVDRDLIDDTATMDGTARGVLGGYHNGFVWGWAEIVGQAEPVTVRIEVDGENRATLVADRFRADLVEKGLHPTGEAGFRTRLDPPLEPGAEIKAFIVGTGMQLYASPMEAE